MHRPREFHSESDLVAYLQKLLGNPPGVVVGIGDDAAVIPFGRDNLVVTTDSLVEDVHFRLPWVTPGYLGQKASLVNLSDLAAMGAVPRYALISLIFPKKYLRRDFIEGFYRGLEKHFQKHRVTIIGGNTSRGNNMSITVTLFGTTAHPLLRSTAQAGDLIWCTGTLGAAAREVSLLEKGKKKHMIHLPPDRVQFAHALANTNCVHACIDISDGLAKDLNTLCIAGKVSATLFAPVPPSGEDYELLFTAPQKVSKTIEGVARSTHTPVRRIGAIHTEGKRLLADSGWDHLR